MADLTGKIVLVTGAAGAIGRRLRRLLRGQPTANGGERHGRGEHDPRAHHGRPTMTTDAVAPTSLSRAREVRGSSVNSESSTMNA